MRITDYYCEQCGSDVKLEQDRTLIDGKPLHAVCAIAYCETQDEKQIFDSLREAESDTRFCLADIASRLAEYQETERKRIDDDRTIEKALGRIADLNDQRDALMRKLEDMTLKNKRS